MMVRRRLCLVVQREKRQERFFDSNEGFQRGGFSHLPTRKGCSKDFTQNKGREKDLKGKDKEGAYPQSGLSASESPSEEGYGHAWESDDWSSSYGSDDSSTSAAEWSCTRAQWMASVPLNLANDPTHVVPDFGFTRSIGSRAAIKKFLWHYDRILSLQ